MRRLFPSLTFCGDLGDQAPKRKAISCRGFEPNRWGRAVACMVPAKGSCSSRHNRTVVLPCDTFFHPLERIHLTAKLSDTGSDVLGERTSPIMPLRRAL